MVKSIEDERIIYEKRRINSNAFGICFLALWGILVYRQFILQQDIKEYIDIFLLTIGLSIYVTINNVFKGLYLTYRSKESRKRTSLISAAVGSIAFILVQFFVVKYDLSNGGDIFKLIVSFILFFAIWLISQGILLKISEAKSNEDEE